MNIEALSPTGAASPSRGNEPAQKVEQKRQDSQQPQSTQQETKIQPEELLKQIKALTEEGLYSVRFEKDSGSQQMIVKIVDTSSDTVIRQIPSENLLNLNKYLRELSGNIVNTHS